MANEDATTTDPIILTPETIDERNNLLTRIVGLREGINTLKAEQTDCREKIFASMQEHGEVTFQGRLAFASIKVRKMGPKYSASEVDNLMTAWLESENSDIKSCGQMLERLRKEPSESKPFLEIR